MKTTKLYYFEDGEERWQRDIDHAFNRMTEFAPRLHPIAKTKTKESVAFNRIVNGEFREEDVDVLVDYAFEVAEESDRKYNGPTFRSAPWADSVLQAAVNLRRVMLEFREWFIHHPTHE